MQERFPWDHPILHTPALWHPQAPRNAWVSVCFRRPFELSDAVEGAAVLISASQRLELWLDGRRLARGPSRSDEDRWPVVRVALPGLAAGRHVLAVRVSHFGDLAGMGQMGPAAFLLACPDPSGPALDIDTGRRWTCLEDASRRPLPRNQAGPAQIGGVVGCGEIIDAGAGPWGWQEVDFDDTTWPAADVLAPQACDDWGNLPLGCRLVPDRLPQMTERGERFTRVADAPPELIDDAARCIAGDGPVTVPAGSTCRLVLDRGELTNAYPLLTLTGGRGATVDLVSVEAPRGPGGHKGNRDEIVGKTLPGHCDRILPGGGSRRAISTLWFRSLRYLVIDVTTAGQPLTVDDVQLLATGFPLARTGGLTEADPSPQGLTHLLDVCHRSIRLCAHETFFDCPHYEQCQFPGDTRVQALYHYAICDDDRLARKAIDDFHASRRSDGMLVCRWPSRKVQILPTFALAWVAMLDEFRIWRGDLEFLRPYLPAARGVIEWFLARRRPDGLIGRVEHAPFVDWAEGFEKGNATQDPDGGSAWIALHLADACCALARLERHTGHAQRSSAWQDEADHLLSAVREQCWNPQRGLFAETPAGDRFSEHTQHQAILAGAVTGQPAADLLARSAEDADIIRPGTFYARHAHLEAARRAGIGGPVLRNLLGGWLESLNGTGLTTLPEANREIPRSDCHAWSVAPAMALVHSLLGLQPDDEATGLDRLLLAPDLGSMRSASGVLPTPHGPVHIELRRSNDGCTDVDVDAPVPVRVTGEDRDLPPGRHQFRLPCD